MSSGRKTVLDFSMKLSIDKKGLDDFYNFNPRVESGQFIEKTFMRNAIEGFLHVNLPIYMSTYI